MANQTSGEFERVAATARDGGVLGDFWHLLRTSRKWWLLPIVALLLIFGTLMLLGGTAAAPFIYTLF